MDFPIQHPVQLKLQNLWLFLPLLVISDYQHIFHFFEEKNPKEIEADYQVDGPYYSVKQQPYWIIFGESKLDS